MTIIIPLKGGSLSRTYSMPQYNMVCKSVSTTQEREYGFMRWYSQTKKMQRLSALHPDLFPEIHGFFADGELAEVKMELLKGYRDVKSILSNDTLTEEQIFKISKAIWNGLNRVHSRTYSPIHGAGLLYFTEEVVHKLNDANLSSDEFYEFTSQKTFQYRGQTVKRIGVDLLNQMHEFFSDLRLIEECDILGNPTLENIMYSFDKDEIKFIDLYEESMIDTRFLDYSMVLQCSRSHYGYINDNQVIVDGNSVSHKLQIPKNFETFNYHFEAEIAESRTREIVNVFEATQFIRMLPFKIKAGELNKAMYFYVHACYLLNKVFG
jgi:hypothetical protein